MKEDMKHLHNAIHQESNIDRPDINKLWTMFKDGLETRLTSTNKHIPSQTCKTKDKNPWITREIKSLIRRKDRAYKKKKKSNHPDDCTRFKELKKTAQKSRRQTYWKFIENIITPENPEETHFPTKRFWTYIKHRISGKSKVAPLRKMVV